jgi:IS1 family transposase
MNKADIQTRVLILKALVDGNSLRAAGRIAGVAYNTVLKFLPEVGEACAWYQDEHLRGLSCKKIQVDEIWSFCYSKQKNVPEGMEGNAGDLWTWTAICADTKLVPSWRIGSRDGDTALDFISDLGARLANRVQLTSDGHKAYLQAVEQTFGNDVDYAQLVKLYGENTDGGQKRYSPADCIGIKKTKISGDPDLCCVSTSFVERQNLTMRMSMRRFTRLTNAFSKKVENHNHAVALHFMHYNFVRQHKSLNKLTPAMASGVTGKLWELEDIVRMVDLYWMQKKRGKIAA